MCVLGSMLLLSSLAPAQSVQALAPEQRDQVLKDRTLLYQNPAAPKEGAKSKDAGALAPQPAVVRGDEITPAQQDSVRRGLRWLADHQARDGSFSAGPGSVKNVAVTALAGVAFMQAGNLPGRGEYGENVQKVLAFLLASCQESGLVAADESHGPMYGHGFATLFLGEVYGMNGD